MSVLDIFLLSVLMYALGMLFGAIVYSQFIDKPEVENNIKLKDKRRFRIRK